MVGRVVDLIVYLDRPARLRRLPGERPVINRQSRAGHQAERAGSHVVRRPSVTGERHALPAGLHVFARDEVLDDGMVGVGVAAVLRIEIKDRPGRCRIALRVVDRERNGVTQAHLVRRVRAETDQSREVGVVDRLHLER